MIKYEPRTLKRGEVIGFYIETTTEPTLFSEPRLGFYIETTTEPTLFSEPRPDHCSACRLPSIPVRGRQPRPPGGRVKGRVTLDTVTIGLVRTGSSKLHMDIYQLVKVSGLMHGSAVIHCL